MSVDSIKNTFYVALGVCFFSSILVSTAAVGLKPIQDENKRIDKIKNILLAGDLYDEEMEVEEIYQKYIEAKVVNLETGEYVLDEECDEPLKAANYDVKKISQEPKYSRSLSQSEDWAGIRRSPTFMVIYEVVSDSTVEKYILPIYGKGLWSTLYGFLALGKDLKTIEGFTFYDHGETPGLGGEVDNPRWKKSWQGKQAYDGQGNVIIKVLKGTVDPSSSDANHEIDGLSGSTLTTRGVDNLVRFWMSDLGYGPLVENLKKGASHE